MMFGEGAIIRRGSQMGVGLRGGPHLKWPGII